MISLALSINKTRGAFAGESRENKRVRTRVAGTLRLEACIRNRMEHRAEMITRRVW